MIITDLNELVDYHSVQHKLHLKLENVSELSSTHQGFTFLKENILNYRLIKLELINFQKESDIKENNDPFIMLISLFKGKNLKVLNLTNTFFNPTRIKALCELLASTNTSIDTLNLSECALHGENLSKVANAIKNNNTVKEFNLRLNSINSSDFSSLNQILQVSNLTVLKLSANNLSDINLDQEKFQDFLTLLSKAKCLKSLFLEANNLTSEMGVKIFNALSQNQTFSEIDLGSNRLDNTFCFGISDSLNKGQISKIYLRSNLFGFKGEEILRKAYEKNSNILIIAASEISYNSRLNKPQEVKQIGSSLFDNLKPDSTPSISSEKGASINLVDRR